MSQVGDPAIKLFGRNIPSVCLQHSDSDCHTPSIPPLMYEFEATTKAEVDEHLIEKPCKGDIPSGLDNQEDIKCQNHPLENEANVDKKSEEDQVTNSEIGDQEKVLKRPNKILPCPRCNSLETKFCYFNNYNVNQPRHFCRKCQRYWTAGGTIRNVPVGAGRRKNKHSSAQCHQVVVPPNVVSVTRADTLTSASSQHHSCAGLPSFSKGTGEILKFSKDTPLCESMANVLNLKEQKGSVEIGSSVVEDNSEEPLSSDSSLAAVTSEESEFSEKEFKPDGLPGHCRNFNPMHTMQCYPVPQWAYHWNQGWHTMMFGLNNCISNSTHMSSTPVVPVPGFSAPSITFPFLPASYWGCMPSWDTRNWNTSLVGSTGSSSASSSTSNNSCSGNSSLILGKHSRDANSQVEDTMEQNLWVPKTLRIDDPEEAAKSSIWSTLGIRPDKDKPIIKGGIFKAFQSKSDTTSHTSDTDQVLQANPAAFSRSQSFREST